MTAQPSAALSDQVARLDHHSSSNTGMRHSKHLELQRVRQIPGAGPSDAVSAVPSCVRWQPLPSPGWQATESPESIPGFLKQALAHHVHLITYRLPSVINSLVSAYDLWINQAMTQGREACLAYL